VARFARHKNMKVKIYDVKNKQWKWYDGRINRVLRTLSHKRRNAYYNEMMAAAQLRGNQPADPKLPESTTKKE